MKSVLLKIKNITNANEIEEDELKEVLFAILENYPIGQRNPKHIGLISQALLTIEFFKKLENARGEDSIRLCANQMKYEVHENSQDIIVHGERGDKFYIILQGVCEIYVPNSQGQFVKVGELVAGQSFGELALINDSPRRATIKALTDCHLAVLLKQDYIKIIGEMEEREIKKKIQFMENLPLFNQIHRRAMHEYIYYFKIVNFKWKDVVYQQDEEPQFVYIIKSGEFILQKFSRQEKSQNSGIFPITAQVAIIGPGEIFGEVDCLVNERRHFSVTCHSQQAEVFIISKKHFVERIMDNYNIREKNFVENYLNKKIGWRNDRMNNIKTVKRIAEQDIKLGGTGRFSPMKSHSKHKKDSIHYDQNTPNDYGSNYNSPLKAKRDTLGFNNIMITEIGGDTTNTNPSIIIGGGGTQNSPGSFSYLGKKNQLQINLRSITTATPSLSKRASSAFPSSNTRHDAKLFTSHPEHQSIGTIEDVPLQHQFLTEHNEDNYLNENSQNLASSNLLDALILSSPLKNKFNQNAYIKLKDIHSMHQTPARNSEFDKLAKKQEIFPSHANKNGVEPNGNNSQNKNNIEGGVGVEEQDGMKKFLKTNSVVYKLRKLNQAKLEICKQQNIDVQGKSFKNIGIIEDFELPKYVLNKLKNQNAIMSLLHKGQTPKAGAGSSQGNNHSQVSSTMTSPQKKRSISSQNNNQYPVASNYFQQQQAYLYSQAKVRNNSTTVHHENDFQKINNILSAPLQKIENEKLKSIITQMRYIDYQQYKIQNQQQQQLKNSSILGNKSLVASTYKEDNFKQSQQIQQKPNNRSLSPMNIPNKNSSILMQKMMITPIKNFEMNHVSNISSINPSNLKPASQFTTQWEHSPQISPPKLFNPHATTNLSNIQMTNIKLQ